MYRFFGILILWSFYSFGNAHTLKVYIADLPPWLKTSENRCDGGILCDVFKVLDKEPSIKIDYQVLSLGRANKMAFEGKQDMAFFPQDDVFLKDYIEIGKLLDYKLGHFSLKDSPKGKICTLARSPHNQKDQDYLKVNSLEQCFKMLLHKRVQAILLTDIELRLLKKKFSKAPKGIFTELKVLSIWFYINKKVPKDIREKLSNNFTAIQKNY